jgi:predicted permease
VAVASYAFWQRLGQPSNLVGSQILINQRPFTVIGLAPQGFLGLHAAIGPEVWLPLGAERFVNPKSPDLMASASTRLNLCGSLRPGLTFETATSRLTGMESELGKLSGEIGNRQLVLTSPPRLSLGNVNPVDESFLGQFQMLSMGLASIVLLVAGLNLANMFLARGIARRKEIAVRFSLGATRWQVVRQLLVEGLLLAMVGGVLGLLLTEWAYQWVQAYYVTALEGMAFAFNSHPPLDGSLLRWTFVCAIAAAMIFSVVPALRATRINLAADLKAQVGGSGGTDGWNRFFTLRHSLMMAQIALALVLLFGASLFLRSAKTVLTRALGSQTDRSVVLHLSYDSKGELPKAAIVRQQQDVLAHAAGIPGLESVALASGMAYSFSLEYHRIYRTGTVTQSLPRDTVSGAPYAGYRAVSRNYFQTLGIPLIKGRDFTVAESTGAESRAVAIIDNSLALALFPDEEALGRYMVVNETDPSGQRIDRTIEIIGIVESPSEEVFETKSPRRYYRPIGQMNEPDVILHGKVALSGAVADTLARLRREVRALQPDVPVLLATSLSDFVYGNLNLLAPKLAAAAFSGIGMLSLFLAVIGVYGVKTHEVTGRTREIGIRMALGARPAEVLSLVLRQGGRQTVVGICIGLILAIGAGQLLGKMLYRVSGFDPLALVVVAVVLAATSLFACWLPARRAAKVDPVIALRSE